MAKHTNTSGADDLLLRYVLNELDPSEERLVEQAMLEDENVLIEIESLRLTLKKLRDLPQFAPPPEVRENILQAAARQAETNRKQSARNRLNRYFRYYTMPAAALMIIALGLGYFLYFLNAGTQQPESAPFEQVQSPQNSGVQSTGTARLQPAIPADVPAVHFSGFGHAAASALPWGDARTPLRIQVTNGVTELTPSEIRFTQFQNSSAPKPANRSAFDFTSKPRDFHLIQTAR